MCVGCLFAALGAKTPGTADGVRAIADRHGDVEAFEAHADRVTFEVEFVSIYVTTRETDGWAHGCFEYVWVYGDVDDSSYTEVGCA